MPLIVDTYNVLHVVGVLPPEEAGIDLPGLIRLIQHSRYRDERVELICDGSPREDVPPGKRRATVVRYSGPTRLADDVIMQMIRASTIPKRLTVVSLDHQVIRAARRRRCRVLASDVFLRQLANDVRVPTLNQPIAPPPNTVTSSEVKTWQKYFDIDDATVESLEAEADREARRLRPGRDQCVDGGSAKPQAGAGSSRKADTQQHSSSNQHEPVLPPELIEEAERLLRQLDRRNRETDRD
jgi:hypothetical protein